MNGCIVQIWFEVDGQDRSKSPHYQFVQTNFPDFEAFCAFADTDRLIAGEALWCVADKGGERFDRIIRNRQPIAFRGTAVMRCALPTSFRFFDQ